VTGDRGPAQVGTCASRPSSGRTGATDDIRALNANDHSWPRCC
jgi:hypothetical protein